MVIYALFRLINKLQLNKAHGSRVPIDIQPRKRQQDNITSVYSIRRYQRVKVMQYWRTANSSLLSAKGRSDSDHQSGFLFTFEVLQVTLSRRVSIQGHS